MNDGIAVRAGWASTGAIRELMSPGLRARVAQADAEDAAAVERAQRAHRAAWEVANERAIDVAAQQLAAAEGIPLREVEGRQLPFGEYGDSVDVIRECRRINMGWARDAG